MAFAVFYEHTDLAAIVANANPNNSLMSQLTSAQRQIARRVWDGGLKDWQTAPFGQSPFDPPGACSLCRTVVINATPNVTLQEFRDLLTAVANIVGVGPDVQYIRSLAEDMGGVSGAVEPWPIA
jgi:hypothetical protein